MTKLNSKNRKFFAFTKKNYFVGLTPELDLVFTRMISSTVMFKRWRVEGDNLRNPYSRLYSTMYSSSGITEKTVQFCSEKTSIELYPI